MFLSRIFFFFVLGCCCCTVASQEKQDVRVAIIHATMCYSVAIVVYIVFNNVNVNLNSMSSICTRVII